MQISTSEVPPVVSAAFRQDTPLQLVEDTWTSDAHDSPENRRIWCSTSGAELSTATARASSESSQQLAERAVDALVGAVMERSGATGEAVAVAVREAGAAEPWTVPDCLIVDRVSRSGVSAWSGGIAVRAVVAGGAVVVAIFDDGPVSLVLGSPDRRALSGW